MAGRFVGPAKPAERLAELDVDGSQHVALRLPGPRPREGSLEGDHCVRGLAARELGPPEVVENSRDGLAPRRDLEGGQGLLGPLDVDEGRA